MTKERLEIVKLVWRVHVGEQALRTAKTIDFVLLDGARRHLLEHTEHRQAPLGQQASPDRVTPACVHRAQRMISAFGSRERALVEAADEGRCAGPARPISLSG